MVTEICNRINFNVSTTIAIGATQGYVLFEVAIVAYQPITHMVKVQGGNISAHSKEIEFTGFVITLSIQFLQNHRFDSAKLVLFLQMFRLL
jgi:hypothetical protein